MDVEGLNSRDIVYGIIYIKNYHYLEEVMDYLKKEKLDDFPVAVCTSDICRDELLFEIEIEAFKKLNN